MTKCERRVLMLCGDYMEDYEAMVPFQALEAYGVAVDAVSPGRKAGDVCRTSIHCMSGRQAFFETIGHNFTLNATFDEVEVSKYDGLVIPGGRSPEHLALNPSVIDLVTKFSHSKKPIASVCHAPLILAAAGLAKGLKCTGFRTVGPVLVAAGAHWLESNEACITDGHHITAVTFESHPEFIRSFLRALGGNITTGSEDKKILFLCADYMENYEIKVPFQCLEALGCHVDAVCPKKKGGETCQTAVHELFEGDQTYSIKRGYDFTLTADFEGLELSSYDGLVIPGGRGAAYLRLDERVTAVAKHFMEANKPVASIGLGQQILAAAGLLKGRKCTAYPTVKVEVVLAGATWLEADPIFTDGNLVTAAAWPGHPQLLSQFMKLLGIQVTF